MQPTICARCKKNVALIFITKMEPNGNSSNEGLCLKCAKELNLGPVDDVMRKMGISEEDLDSISSEMIEAFGGAENLSAIDGETDEEGEPGNMATFPFLDKLFGSGGPGGLGAPMERPQQPQADNNSGAGKTQRDKKRKFLESYCISLTDKAREGKLDRIIGREEELERVIQILNRRQKNNPCLIGEPGVGKTAIAEGLAIRINAGEVPYKLRGREVHLLDLTALVAGTQFRGQFESRMKGLIEEIKKQGNIV
ncbi:MAG: AAA family ATPase, partial [Oscillospiraceae bacterium]|nr:AAA family ATPase [Oscillospiraceae bacterium]